MNSTLTLKLDATVQSKTAKTLTAAQVIRTVARKWDMFAVIGLMASSAVYGVYALTQMTGF
ncbi:MAG: hypothetical protein ACRYFS_04465 [Janthinobacterium lividum]